MSKGFAKFPRAILESRLWRRQEKDKPFTVREMRIYLTMKANWAPAKVPIGNQILYVPKGGILTSQQKISEDSGWDRKRVREFLRREANADRLVFETKWGRDSGYTLITLKDIWGLDTDFKWGEMQSDEGEVSADSPFDSPLTPHIQENKEVSSLGRYSSYVGIFGSENGSHSRSEDGVLKSARAEPGAIVEVEKAFIGCLLTDESITPELAAFVKPGDFYTASIGKVFECILTLFNRNEAITLLALNSELKRLNIHQPSASEIAEWAEDVKPSLARFYAESIKGASDARRSEVTRP